MLLSLSLNHWKLLHGLVVLFGLVLYVVTAHARRQYRHPSAAIAWVISLALLPYLALPLYLLFGNRKVLRSRPHPDPAFLPSPTATGPLVAICQQLAAAMGLPGTAAYHSLTLHRDGAEALSALYAVIDGARTTLDLCTFLFGRDAFGGALSEKLIRRARDGVHVRLMIDGIGVYLGGRPNLQRMKAAGIEVELFVSPWRSVLPGRTNLRNHRKMVIADGLHVWTGGRNLAAEYFVGEPGKAWSSVRSSVHSAFNPAPPWLDLSFDFRGELAQRTQQQFDHDWRFAIQKRLNAPVAHAAAPIRGADQTVAQLIVSGPDQIDDTLYALLISTCFASHRSIAIVTPYFVPDPTLLMALTLAARRGVAIDLLLPGRSNHWLADFARHAALRELAAAGARIWFAPRMIHAKAVVIDDELAFAGSANLDVRSLFLNYEMMFAFHDAADVRRFAQWIAKQRDEAIPYVAHRPGILSELGEGLIRLVAFQL